MDASERSRITSERENEKEEDLIHHVIRKVILPVLMQKKKRTLSFKKCLKKPNINNFLNGLMSHLSPRPNVASKSHNALQNPSLGCVILLPLFTYSKAFCAVQLWR